MLTVQEKADMYDKIKDIWNDHAISNEVLITEINKVIHSKDHKIREEN